MKQLEIKRPDGSQRLPSRIKTIVSENSWKFTFLCSSKEIHKVTQTSKEIHKWRLTIQKLQYKPRTHTNKNIKKTRSIQLHPLQNDEQQALPLSCNGTYKVSYDQIRTNKNFYKPGALISLQFSTQPTKNSVHFEFLIFVMIHLDKIQTCHQEKNYWVQVWLSISLTNSISTLSFKRPSIHMMTYDTFFP